MSLKLLRHRHTHITQEDGAILVTLLGIMIFLTITMLSLSVLVNSNVSRSHGRILQLEAQYAAESGADAAIAYLNSSTSADYSGTGGSEVTVLTATGYKATFSTSVTTGTGDNQRIIIATGKVYAPASSTTPSYTRTIRVTAARTSTTSASSMVSRNILAIASAVKSVNARDIFVDGYITMAKNSTVLTAENITVAGKNSGASNCSIGGAGSLAAPSSFSNPGQTKTNITVAYNNCISPPGNTSNTSFNVSANNNTISQVQSLYIPWSQYMDSSYQNAGSCNDWTSGGSVRQIPSVSGSKATHYPDSGSNVASSCGNNGDLSLGSNQYNITDNVHIRANLCAATACTPTFYNPTSSMKYVFVEGTINFASVQTASGSGPITFITYGADPASKVSVCPYGGSIYIGGSASLTSDAPAAYFLATNGICLDKLKFSGNPSLGGIGGKNIYINTQQGQPFDLALDPNFPVQDIPIDLSWRETGYEPLN